MVPNSEKLMEVFIGGLPRSIEGNVTALKPQTLEEAITITQRLMDQVTKHNYVQGTSDHKRKFDDIRTYNNNSNHNNDHHQQQIRRQETFRAYVATLTKNNRYAGNFPSVKDAPCITQDLALSSVRLATRIICDEKVVHIPIDDETLIIRGAALVARAPYRLAPSQMQELSNQLQE
nr:reverse transcriptase domain-containing protein [Tanacetum cinerariifolium]